MHYYWIQNGIAQRYIQKTKDGRESQRINKKKAAEDGACPSVTTYLHSLGDPGGLLVWTQRLGVKAGLEVGLREGLVLGSMCIQESDADLIAQAMKEKTAEARKLAEEYGTEAANQGTAIHDAIENYMAHATVPENPIHLRAAKEAVQLIGSLKLVNPHWEHCCVFRGVILGEPVAFGGTADVVAENWLVDWKTVAKDGRGNYRKPKATEAAQLAAYRLGFGVPEARCLNAYFDRDTGEMVGKREWTEAELAIGLELLVNAVQQERLMEAIK